MIVWRGMFYVSLLSERSSQYPQRGMEGTNASDYWSDLPPFEEEDDKSEREEKQSFGK